MAFIPDRNQISFESKLMITYKGQLAPSLCAFGGCHMFGYVRPEKPDLLIRDFTAYKAIYCGLCKALGRRSGQIPRTAVTYDMTFLALLLLALAPQEPAIGEESCILNPLKKRPVLETHPVLDYAADLTVILAYYSAKDDAADEKPLRGRLLAGLFSRPAGRARRRHADLDRLIRQQLGRIDSLQKGDQPLEAAQAFGDLLKAVFGKGFEKLGRQDEDDDLTLHLLEEAGSALGRWVYLMDAIDDLAADRKAGNPNPFLALSDEEARLQARDLLLEAEEALDRHLALVSYERLGQLVYNIVTLGIPATRRRILAGERLPAL